MNYVACRLLKIARQKKHRLMKFVYLNHYTLLKQNSTYLSSTLYVGTNQLSESMLIKFILLHISCM